MGTTALAITGFTPTSGPTSGGTTVTITGTGFAGTTAVKFGTTSATTFRVTGTTKIIAKTKAQAAGNDKIHVTTPSGTATSSAFFTFVAPPTITSFTPTSGPTTGGTTVTITGTNFTGATSVKFGTTAAASYTVTSSTKIKAVTKPHAAGTVKISIKTVDGTGTSSGNFTFVAPPAITSFTPTSGTSSGGTTVTVTGTNFTGATSVKFGTTAAASYTVTSATKIKAVTKSHAAATVKISVTTPGGTATSTANFKFVAGTPTITSFTPTSGSTAGFDTDRHQRDQLHRGHIGQVRHNSGRKLPGDIEHPDPRQDQAARTGNSQDLGHHGRRDGHLGVVLQVRGPRPDRHKLHTHERLHHGWDHSDHQRDQLHRGHIGQVRHDSGHIVPDHKHQQDHRQDQGARGRHSQDLGHHPRRDGHLDGAASSSSFPRRPPSPASRPPAARRWVGPQ